MKKLFITMGIVFCALTFLFMACGTATKYNPQNYPDSIIIKAFDRAGINPESFSKRILKALKYEIATGKYTRDQVMDFLDIWAAKIQVGVGYPIVGDLIEKYGKEILSPIGDNVSEAANLAYILFMPDLPSFDVPKLIDGQDKEVALDFIHYLQERL